LRQNLVDVQFGGFGNDLNVRYAAGEVVLHGRGASWNPALSRRGDGPEQFQRSPLDGARRQVVAAQPIDRGGGALSLAANGTGEREGDSRQGRREPQNRQQCAAAAAQAPLSSP